MYRLRGQAAVWCAAVEHEPLRGHLQLLDMPCAPFPVHDRYPLCQVNVLKWPSPAKIGLPGLDGAGPDLLHA